MYDDGFSRQLKTFMERRSVAWKKEGGLQADSDLNGSIFEVCAVVEPETKYNFSTYAVQLNHQQSNKERKNSSDFTMKRGEISNKRL